MCAGVTCLEGQVCEKGLCLSDCGCRACGDGRACGMDGKCVDTGCETLTCQAGQVCVAGACKDACDGAVCPGGADCVNGACQPPMMMEAMAGTGGGEPLGGTFSFGGMAGVLNLSGGGTGGATGGKGNGNNAHPILKSGETATGCNCRAAGNGRSSALVYLLAAAAGVVALRRRRAA